MLSRKAHLSKVCIFFLFLMICSGLLVHSAKSVANYEWVQNPSFEPYVNRIEDSGFESGDWNSGVVYGNWSILSGSWVFTTSQYHTGIKSLYIANGFNDNGVWYNLTSSKMGADIGVGTFWSKRGSNVDNWTVTYYYDDLYSNTYDCGILTTSWSQFSFMGGVDVNRYLNALKFELKDGTSLDVFIDDFELYYTTDENAQEVINYASSPWYSLTVISGNAGITNDTANYGNQSCVFTPTAQHFPVLVQSINNLDSNTVTGFNIWANNAGTNSYMQMGFYYSDGTQSNDQRLITSGWNFYNFLGALVEDKIIIGIFIQVLDYSATGWLYIDDVSLTSTDNYLPFTSIVFDFDIVPAPISYNSSVQWTGFIRTTSSKSGFTAYANFQYVFNGHLSDLTNGTFTVTGSYGSVYGSVSLGNFTFNIADRISKGLKVNATEQFIIQINNNVTISSYSINAYWVVPSNLIDGGGTTPSTFSNMQTAFIQWFPVFLIMGLFTIPATIYLGVGGFVGGFSMSCIICVWMGLGTVWLLPMAVLTDLTVLYAGVPSVRNTINETVSTVKSRASRGKEKLGDKLEDLED